MNAERPKHWDAPTLHCYASRKMPIDGRRCQWWIWCLTATRWVFQLHFPQPFLWVATSLKGWWLTQIHGKILSQTVLQVARKTCLIMRLPWLSLILANARFKLFTTNSLVITKTTDLACVLYNSFNTYAYFRSCWYDYHVECFIYGVWRHLRSLIIDVDISYLVSTPFHNEVFFFLFFFIVVNSEPISRSL